MALVTEDAYREKNMESRTTMHLKQYSLVALTAGFVITSVSSVVAQPVTADQGQSHQGHQADQGQGKSRREPPAAKVRTLPPIPTNLPDWMNNKDTNHIYRKRGSYNDAIYNVRSLALDLNALAVGHAFAYQDLVTGKAGRLETDTFNRINWVLKNQPRFMPDEANISSAFGRKYGVLEQVFDWTHILHAQTVDVLASTKLTGAEKDAEVDRLYRFYSESVPYAITPLPMNMGYLDSQPYSQAFRRKYPKVNGLFWGYHWLQGRMYDTLDGKTLQQQRDAYAIVGKRYHEVELYRTNRPFMPMFAEVSPKFAKKFPHISNTFDNLHMLHDMVNDILASDWMSEAQKEGQIKRALWMLSADAHKGMKPGDFNPNNSLHDHRFMEGMPGMGMMPEGLMKHGGMDHGTTPMNKTQGATEQEGTIQPSKTPKSAPDAGTVPLDGHRSH
ncbi:hypothetical protein AVDCRST_MAG81-366 [uncultured Synechococcales cyanobacterium]|uniref:Uncharacterized protein n=1 Tax=uncultured Synechococcales cyanobacterium TaxID=1936017 RepID=A0A6J4UQK9_9CYAN|nr:hypothetical protein AVDCRST_MAG81-366 [uncultured Synechococcales cyanobacterium]